ncbi:hypothetical protein RclHR1_09180001 [Rhizophagus clarus]|uniref:Uncharacterized protein n=1 Tax=Rhizophagus clarus TaxID=94130 RepID=A0A2Z6S2R9_9GLOM|nr:hypothetical protein RclHR1_31940001 [Rhizophagus clarus]GBC09867.1 hypothetical protein RclHR1_09180001 [Rhizophagus clarus]GET04114.1 hypothetical protein GLOIN_2v1884028 [Rhizophagus clarus]
MDKNPPQDNRFIEFNNLQQSTAAVIQSGHEHSSNIDYNAVNVNVDHSMMNDNSILLPHTNINQSTSQSYPPPITSSYAPQYPPQSIENTSFPLSSINPSQSGIYSFDIPGFKIIVIPTFSRQDNPYLNSSSNNMGNQFTQFNQFQR